MGNRAVITTEKNFKNNGVGVYVHWNGDWTSVTAFLEYCKKKEYLSPDISNYGFSRLCQVIGNYFGGVQSIGIDVLENLDCDNGDNGVYLIKDWDIVGRKYQRREDFKDIERKKQMLIDIDSAQPSKERLGQTYRVNVDGHLDSEVFDDLEEAMEYADERCLMNHPIMIYDQDNNLVKIRRWFDENFDINNNDGLYYMDVISFGYAGYLGIWEDR